jgi:hypothetical protein
VKVFDIVSWFERGEEVPHKTREPRRRRQGRRVWVRELIFKGERAGLMVGEREGREREYSMVHEMFTVPFSRMWTVGV